MADFIGARRGRPIEDGERRVALASRLDETSPAGCDNLLDELVVSGERHCHRIGVCLPSSGRPLDVGEQERHGARDRRKLL